MKIRIFLWCICLVFASAVVAQPLIPYLGANGKYGYAGPAGKLVYPPAFDWAPFMAEDSLGVRVTIARRPYFLLRNGLLLTEDTIKMDVPKKESPIYSMDHFRTPEGSFLIDRSENMDFPTVYSAFLKKILPPGFVLPYKLFDSLRVKSTGLLTVYAKGPDFTQIEDELKILVIGPWQAPTLHKGLISSGVIDARGEWVMPPRPGVHFLPLSHHLIVEITAKTDSSSGLRLHWVNQPGKEPLDLEYVPYPLFSEENNFNMLLSCSGARKHLDYDYYTPFGERITGRPFLYGPNHLRKRNLVTSFAQDSSLFVQILDEKGAVLWNLDPEMATHQTILSADEWDGRYLVVHRRSDNLCGMLDSTGKMVLPFQYHRLRVVLNDRLLCANNEAGKTDLLNWSGEILYTFPKNAYPTCCATEDGHLLVVTDDISLVISPENKVLHTLPGSDFIVSGTSHKAYARLSDKQLKKAYWVHIPSGKTYRER